MVNKKEITNIQQRLLRWYKRHHRSLPWRQTRDPYHIWVSEIMLQQTQVNTVLPYYRKFLKRFPTLNTLADSDLQSVLKAWEGLGYYARARNFHRAAQIVVKEHAGKIPASWKEIKELPGVGDYIAAAILSLVFDLPHAVVDGNVKRVLARLLQIDAPVNHQPFYTIFKQAADRILNTENPGTHNQALMELGAVICKPRSPDCFQCPLKTYCLAYQNVTVSKYPQRKKRDPIPEFHTAVGVVCRNDRLLITQRSTEGLLGGLWEFPGGKVNPDETPKAACVREIKEETNLTVEIESYLTRVRHAYTHFKVKMDVFCCRYVRGQLKLKGPVDYRWIKLEALDAYPLPRANHKFIPHLREQFE